MSDDWKWDSTVAQPSTCSITRASTSRASFPRPMTPHPINVFGALLFPLPSRNCRSSASGLRALQKYVLSPVQYWLPYRACSMMLSAEYPHGSLQSCLWNELPQPRLPGGRSCVRRFFTYITVYGTGCAEGIMLSQPPVAARKTRPRTCRCRAPPVSRTEDSPSLKKSRDTL